MMFQIGIYQQHKILNKMGNQNQNCLFGDTFELLSRPIMETSPCENDLANPALI